MESYRQLIDVAEPVRRIVGTDHGAGRPSLDRDRQRIEDDVLQQVLGAALAIVQLDHGTDHRVEQTRHRGMAAVRHRRVFDTVGTGLHRRLAEELPLRRERQRRR